MDEKLTVYKVLPLSEEDINEFLGEKSVNITDFWSFIEANYLSGLLKNIMIVLYLIENFDSYKNAPITYIDIYHDITKKYLSQRGEDREEETSDYSLDELLLIAASLATYMTFNRKPAVGVDNLTESANELYKVNNKEILADNLNAVLNRGLFVKNGSQVSFFHKSIQEYLTAYFLVSKHIKPLTKSIKLCYN